MDNDKNKPVIICVDDEKIVLDALSRQLQRNFKDNYVFEFAESAEEALNLIKEFESEGQTVVMAISDQIMPGMAGDQFLIQLHQIYPKLIKILLTGQASLESAVKAINQANLYRYLFKPWSEQDFILTVEKGLQQYNLSEQSQKQLNTFANFFPHQFLECLSKQSILDIVLGDHVQREMSILFSDIRNFTSISEMLTPEENYTFINNYIKFVEPAIHNNNGFIDKYIGDAVMALFYKPEDALNAALEMQQVIGNFNKEIQNEKYYPVVSGIGLHTGKLMLGIVGVVSRMQCTVISDAVNLASRLQTLATTTGGLIMASGSFMENLKEGQYDPSTVRFLGKVLVRGKKEVIPVFEIISKDNDTTAQLKVATKEIFMAGLSLFFNKKFAEACVKFKMVLDQNPDDKPATRYLNLAAKYMINGVADDWEGIYLSEEPHKLI